MGDKRVRSVAKTLSWRVIATLTTVLLVWLFTGELILAFSVGVIEFVAKLLFYYLHERTWNFIKWGK